MENATDIDLIRDFAGPIYDGAWHSMFQIEKSNIPAIEEIALLIGRNTSVAERIRLDRLLAELVTKYCGKNRQEDEFLPLFVLCLPGRSLTLGSLTKSLYTILETNIGIHFSSIDWPKIPVFPTVTYVGRRCIRNIVLSGNVFEVGDFVRCYLDTDFQSIRHHSGADVFGPKNREFLGKTLVLSIWREIVFQAKGSSVLCEAVLNPVQNVTNISCPAGGLVLLRPTREKKL